MAFNSNFEILYKKLLSEKTKERSEHIILIIAIASFIIHLALIYLVELGIVPFNKDADLLKNPIAAIYTPFSFILIYEVYLLIHYLPKSISIYISKQYEIIALIIIRRLFKDLSSLSLSADWFKIKYDLQFTYDIITSIFLFFLIYQFYIHSKKRFRTASKTQDQINSIGRFIKLKKILATFLVPLLVLVAIYSFINWLLSNVYTNPNATISFNNINNIFFEQFFTILIIVDVILLLFSFFHTDDFHKVIRNSGFIISTILIRLSFSVSGLLNNVLILSAVVFGLLILIVHNKFEAQLAIEKVD